MKIVVPFTVTPAVLVSTDVTESEFPAYAAGTTYALDAKVIYLNQIWQSIQAGNIGHTPTTSPTWWVSLGATNRWALFDKVVGTKTSKLTSFTYTLQCTGQRVDTVALLNMAATSVRVKVTVSPEGVVYDETFETVATTGISDWWAYYFSPIKRKTSLIISELPAYLSPTIEITVTNAGSTASVGTAILGLSSYVGRTQYGASIGITDYSKKDRDAFGNFIIVERPFNKRGNFTVEVDNGYIDELQETLAALRATSVLYIGTDCYDSTTIYGFYKDFSVVIQYHSVSQCSIEIEGMT